MVRLNGESEKTKLSEYLLKELNTTDETLIEYILHLAENDSLDTLKDHIGSDVLKEIRGLFLGKFGISKDPNTMTGRSDFQHPTDILSVSLSREEEITNYRTKPNRSNGSCHVGRYPVESKREEILRKLRSNQFVMIRGDTGCGKTTQIPKYLLEEYGSVVCTQPRRIAAISMSRRVSEELNTEVGDVVGYKIRFEEMSSDRTRIWFVTDGVLLRECIKDRLLMKYDAIIIDEAHERSINTDTIIGYCKDLVQERKDLKVVIMSATLNVSKLTYFLNCPVVEIKCKMFPSEIFYLKYEEKGDYFYETLKTVGQIYESKPDGNILVFLTGQEEIDEGYKILKKNLGGRGFKLFKLYSSISHEEQNLIFKESKDRKIILSTNIAETSLTIEDIKYVVDCGYVKSRRFLPEHGIDVLEVVKISKAQAKQRAGRTGRTTPGEVYRIYSKMQYCEMEEENKPEILRSNLMNTALLLKSIDVKDIPSFSFVDKPSTVSILKALKCLYHLQALDDTGAITEMGIRMAEIPLDPRLSKALIVGSRLGCLDDLVVICSMISVENVSSEQLPSDKRGDHFAYLRIYKAWEDAGFSYGFCKRRGLNHQNMAYVRRYVNQLRGLFGDSKKGGGEEEVVIALCSGFIMNIARRQKDGYISLYEKSECYIHPSSSLYKTSPPLVLYNDILFTKREYMKHCLSVDPKTLEMVPNNLYGRIGLKGLPM
jgi:ATP-dependent RNA helicase DHX8/PRP22